MADIRINALATTAASTASDDFIAIDGSANGTRKLNAYSPTFGGNLTVGGSNGTLNIKGTGGSASNINADYNLNINVNSLGTAKTITVDTSGNTGLPGNLTVSGTGTSSFASGSKLGVGTTSPGVTFVAVGAPATLNYTIGSTSLADIRSTSAAATNAGPSLTFSGYYQTSLNTSTYGAIKGVLEGAGDGNSAAGSLTFLTANAGGVLSEWARLSYTGNFLLGTTTDLGYRLGINGASDKQLVLDVSAGGRYTSQYWANSGSIKAQAYYDATANSFRLGATAASSSTILVSGGDTTALTLDSSQNATFAGSYVRVSNSGASASPAFQLANGSYGFGHRMVNSTDLQFFRDINSPTAWLTVTGTTGDATFAKKFGNSGTTSISGDVACSVVNVSATGYGLRVQGGVVAGGYVLSALDYAGTERLRLEGNGEMYVRNVGSAPASTPSSGGFLYIEAGALKYKGSSGTVTPIAPA